MSSGLNKYSTHNTISASINGIDKELIDLTNTASKTYVDSQLESYATKTYLQEELIDYSTIEYVNDLVAGISVSGDSADRNLNFYPYSVSYISLINLEAVSDLESSISVGEYAVLIKQDNESENGLYLRVNDTTYTKQTLPSNTDCFFVDITSSSSINCIYLFSSNLFIRTYYKTINLNYSITTNSQTQTDLFNIPVLKDTSCELLLKIFGFQTSNFNISFNGEYKRVFYNNSGVIIDMGDFSETYKKHQDFSYPDINFSSQPDVKLTSGDSEETKWIVKGTLYL